MTIRQSSTDSPLFKLGRLFQIGALAGVLGHVYWNSKAEEHAKMPEPRTAISHASAPETSVAKENATACLHRAEGAAVLAAAFLAVGSSMRRRGPLELV